jgi:hypothetical protein
MKMKFTAYYSLEELNSFVDGLDEIKDFEEFSFEGKTNNIYVLFSLMKDSKEILKMVKLMDKFPLPYVIYEFKDEAFFTVLCFILKVKVAEAKIFGIFKAVFPWGSEGKAINISKVKFADGNHEEVFPPDLDSMNKFLKSIHKVSRYSVHFEQGDWSIFLSPEERSCTWTLEGLMNRLNFKKMQKT